MNVPELKKTRYHHGDLRAAMIAAGRRLAETRGPAAVTIAQAARAAGVTATAPYRHFRDRAAFRDAVAASVFEEFEHELIAVRAAEPEGSAEAIIALGRCYVRFHLERRRFHDLLWGDLDIRGADSECAVVGPRCFAVMLGAIEAYRRSHDLGHLPSEEVVLPLWAFVHGLSVLAETYAFSSHTGEVDSDRLVERTARAFLDGLEARAVQS